jgi:tetratricopeptide (TPR) repeat protein
MRSVAGPSLRLCRSRRRAMAALGSVEGLRWDFLNIVKADPASQIAWYDLGVIAHLHAEDAQAINDYEAALAGDPSYVPALYNLAVLETPTRPKDAAVRYGDVIRLQPANAAAHLNLGFVLKSLGQPVAAETQWNDAIRLAPALSARVPAADRTAK